MVPKARPQIRDNSQTENWKRDSPIAKQRRPRFRGKIEDNGVQDFLRKSELMTGAQAPG